MNGDILLSLLRGGFFLHTTIMAPKLCFKQVGLYDESLCYAEDYDMNLRLAKFYPFMCVSEPLYGYRLHSGNTERRLSRRVVSGYKAVVLEGHLKINRTSLDSSERKRLVRRIFRSYVAARRYDKVLEYSLKYNENLMSLVPPLLGKWILGSHRQTQNVGR